MGFFVSQGVPEKPGNVIGFFYQGLSSFYVDNLISYFLDNSPRQDIKSSQVSH